MKWVEEIKKRNAREMFLHLKSKGWPDHWEFLGKHPELDEIVKEILDDAKKYGIIEEFEETEVE